MRWTSSLNEMFTPGLESGFLPRWFMRSVPHHLDEFRAREQVIHAAAARYCCTMCVPRHARRRMLGIRTYIDPAIRQIDASFGPVESAEHTWAARRRGCGILGAFGIHDQARVRVRLQALAFRARRSTKGCSRTTKVLRRQSQ
jgi:hypothetical protein